MFLVIHLALSSTCIAGSLLFSLGTEVFLLVETCLLVPRFCCVYPDPKVSQNLLVDQSIYHYLIFNYVSEYDLNMEAGSSNVAGYYDL